ncbi:MAG TPA: nucleotide exchange factor GrpE [Oscillospiraceae bacterium]|nr:nucleotide exchange factor GrpE [Oscillospiraceae bacterium]
MNAEEKVKTTAEQAEAEETVQAEADAAAKTQTTDSTAAEEVTTAIVQLQEKNEQLVSRLHRLQADFDNYRKRLANEKKEWHTQAICEVVRELLPVIDNLERANEAAGSLAALKDGVELIHRQLLTALSKQGFEKIEACGQEFDPNFHHAVMQVEGAEPENTVVEELQKGYLVNGRVVRPSMVKVAK